MKKKKKKKRRRKPPEDIVVLQMCTINDNHIMYGSGDMECNGQNFLSFSTVFYSFTPLKKLKPFEKFKKKTLGDIIIFHKSTKNHDHMLYCSWDMVRNGCKCYFSFWAIFCIFTPLRAQKIKILKRRKKAPGDIIILPMCTKNYDQMMYGSLDIKCDGWTDRRMNGQTEK